MNKNSHRPNSNVLHNVTKYNFCCAGINCNNTPRHYLRLLLIDRCGWFCETCKQSLEKDGLVESIICQTVSVSEGKEGAE